ncbi:MAG: helix-turn-helix domain-containing protein [Paraprevotella clara]|nr:helix-turn-helix domain-containing protein [Paraprevotella clara]
MEKYSSLLIFNSIVQNEIPSLQAYKDELVLLTLTPIIDIQSILFSMKVDTFILIVVERGTCKMRVNYLPYQAYNDMFIVLREGVWVTDVSVSDDFMAYAIIVKRDFLRSAMGNNVLPVRELFNRRLLFPAMPVEPVDFERIIDYIRQLRRNLTLHTHMYQSSLIQNALCNINLELWDVTARYLANESCEEEHTPTVREKLAFEFIHAVHQYSRTDHEVAAYADRLNVSPAHLTRMVKEVTDKTASEWIADSLVNEIKFLLHHPGNSIQAIASEVRFSDQAALSKFFKKHTGMTPGEYRKVINKNGE